MTPEPSHRYPAPRLPHITHPFLISLPLVLRIPYGRYEEKRKRDDENE